MTGRRLAVFAGVALAAGCATRDVAMNGARYEYTVQRGLTYTPAGWPEALKADLYVPRGLGPFAAVVLIHGGGWESGDRSDMDDIGRALARRGYAAASISYRFAPRHRFPAQLHDAQQAVRWLRRNAPLYRVQPDRIAAFGYSSGGHLAALLGVVDADDALAHPHGGDEARVAAVVAGGAPFDFTRFEDGRRIDQLLGATRAENPALHQQASPISHVSKGDAPMFVYHGKWDWTVPVAQAEAMWQALDRADVTAELFTVGGHGHISLFLVNSDSINEAFDFLDRHLRR